MPDVAATTREGRRRLRRARGRRWPGRLRVGALLSVVIVLVTLTASAWLPYDPLEPDYLARYAAPSLEHPLGTDALGRDVLSRALVGGQVSLLIATLATAMAVLLGGAFGLIAGERQGRTDAVLVRAFDALLAFPGFLLVLLVVAALGGGAAQTIAALGVAGSPLYFRLTRGFLRSVRKADHVAAARALGAGRTRVLVRHALPGFLGPLTVQAATTMVTFLLVEASLSYLGLGVPLPTPTWGNVLQDARALLLRQPWAALGPGALLASATLALQLLADGARDRLDRRF